MYPYELDFLDEENAWCHSAPNPNPNPNPLAVIAAVIAATLLLTLTLTLPLTRCYSATNGSDERYDVARFGGDARFRVPASITPCAPVPCAPSALRTIRTLRARTRSLCTDASRSLHALL